MIEQHDLNRLISIDYSMLHAPDAFWRGYWQGRFEEYCAQNAIDLDEARKAMPTYA